MTSAVQFTTKQDLEDLYVRMEKMVGDIVGEVVGNALQLISKRFDQVEQRLDKVEQRLDSFEGRFDQFERTYQTTRAIVDQHSVVIHDLQHGTS